MKDIKTYAISQINYFNELLESAHNIGCFTSENGLHIEYESIVSKLNRSLEASKDFLLGIEAMERVFLFIFDNDKPMIKEFLKIALINANLTERDYKKILNDDTIIFEDRVINLYNIEKVIRNEFYGKYESTNENNFFNIYACDEFSIFSSMFISRLPKLK